MDPNANLAEIRKLYREILATDAYGGSPEKELRLAELCEALDEWLSKGGFLPAAWGTRADVEIDVLRKTR